ncbi:Cytochrome P450 family protein [Minicystis rosea]|nr:Cytochrome P450 family protein [Minicystis rosea]
MRLEDIPLLSGANRLGHMEEIRDDRFNFFHRLNRECGDIGRVHALGTPLIFANSPALLHEILVEKAKSFVKSPGLRGPLRPLAGEGLFTSDGDLWKRQRKLMAPLFTHGMVAGYAPTMAHCAREAVAPLRTGEVVDVARLTTHIAMRIAGKTLFDSDTLDEADELGEALTVALRWANDQSSSLPYAAQLRLSGVFADVAEELPEPLRARAKTLAESLVEPIHWPGEQTRRIEHSTAVIERRVERMIAERRAAGLDRRDLLTALLTAYDEDGGMSDKQVRDEIITLFVAGHETTATALAWSLYLLARHPEAYARARDEARQLGGRAATIEDLPKLGYCLKVFKESMRLYPPVYFFGRQASADVRIGAYDLPRGAIILISLYAMQRRPEVWPDPERFDPERFTPAAEEARPKLAWAPFSGGPRTCIGNHFALMEGPIVLATILDRLDLALTSNAEVLPDDSATLRPKGGVAMRVTAVHHRD